MFTQNLLNYYKTGDIGKCGICGKDLSIEIITTPVRDNCVIRCEHCQKEEYFTGTIKIE